MYIKNLLKTTAALATLFAGSQTWGGALNLATLKSDGTLGPVHAPRDVVYLEGDGVVAQTGSAVSAGNIVCAGKSLTFDVVITGNGGIKILALNTLDIYIRSTTKGTAIPAFTIADLILGKNASEVKIWTSDITAVTVSASKDAQVDRDADTTVVSVDLPIDVPTQKKGGRTYTLVKRYSKN